MSTRREFVTLLGGAAAAWPHAARAQQSSRFRRIGVLLAYAEGDREGQSRIQAFESGLQDRGWINGQNIQISYRFGAGDDERSRQLAVELVRAGLDLLVAHSATSLAALRRETNSIPIVTAVIGDLVGSGYVKSLAQPGGNITGFTAFEFAMGGKWLELLVEIAPNIRRVMVVQNMNPNRGSYFHAIEAAARLFKIDATMPDIATAADIGSAIDEFARRGGGGMIVLPGAFTSVHRGSVMTAAMRHRWPVVYPFRYYAADGGLLAYGSDQDDIFRRSATYVDRILKGESPANLPVQQPAKFELVINLKTAKALGLDVPPTLLARADEVIE